MKKSLVLLACASAALVLSGCGGTTTESSSSSTSSSSSSATPSPVSSKSELSFEGGVLTTAEMKIAITDHKIIPVGEKGNEYGKKPVIAFWYQTTNLGGEDMTPMNFLYAMTAYQDNNPNAENKLEVGSLPDDRFLSTQMEKIKKGGTVENAVAYELDDETTAVDLVASNDLGATEIGKMTYPLR